MPVKRRPKIREVEAHVVSADVEADTTGDPPIAWQEPPAEPPLEPVWDESREPPPSRDDLGEPAEEQRIPERPAWPAPVPVREARVATPMFSEEFCEITFWRGYFKAAFYARLVADDDPLTGVARSPYFRHRGAALPARGGDALSAYEALREQLEHTGWERVRQGALWFADVFRRRA
jgi:hypothetical protein